MKKGLKRLNKRQLKKITNSTYYWDSRKYEEAFRTGRNDFIKVCEMEADRKEPIHIVEKAESTLKYALKVYGMSMEALIMLYKENYTASQPYIKEATLNDALQELASDAGYICDRYLGEYRLVRFLYHLDLCKNLLGLPTYREVSFTSEEEIIAEFKEVFEQHLNKNFTITQFNDFYDEKIKELKELTESEDIYEFGPETKYEALRGIRYILNLKKDTMKDKDLALFDLYQMMFVIKQAEKELGFSFYQPALV